MSTIRRNSKRAKTMFQEAKACTVYSLENEFRGAACPASWAEKQYQTFGFAKARQNHNGTVTIQIHSNCWYDLAF